MEKLRSMPFDLGISETLDVCGFGLFKMLNVRKTIVAMATALPGHLTQSLGLPNPTAFVPDGIFS
jgi:hypothetical protein